MDSNNNTNGFSSPRGDAFPNGLRVLVVDDDPTWLKILEKMLKKCSYEVTTCGLATEALDLLRERKDGFDIVISDVNMPDMDGFKLLEQVGLEMDLPVIMMSVDGETSRVMKGVQHGACDYLSKPIRMKELKNIWQHVLRKRIHETRDIEGHEGLEEIQMIRNGISDQFDDGFFFCGGGGDFNFGKKRKDFENKHDDKDFGDSSTAKKTRVVWTVDLHQKFVKAVNQIGFDKVGPKKILDLMNVPWLTRENVASHLQKYRLYLSRLQKDNDFKTSNGGVKHSSDLISKEQAGNIVFQNSINMKQRDTTANSNYGIPQNSIIMKQSDEAANSNYGIPQNSIIMKQSDEAASSSYGIPQNSVNTKHNDSTNCNFGIISANIVIQNANTRIHESGPIPEPERVVICDAHETQKASSSVIGLNHNFGSLEPEANYSPFCSIVPPQHSWTRGVPEIQFKQEHQSHLDLNNGFNHLPLPDDLHNQIQVNNHLQPIPSIYPRHFNKERDKHDLGPLQSGSPTTNYHPSQPITRSTWSMNNQVVNPILINDLNSGYGNLSSPLPACLLQEDCSPINFEVQNKEFYDCNNPELIAEVPPYLYDALRFDYEYSCDSTEYPVIDQGLFIV